MPLQWAEHGRLRDLQFMLNYHLVLGINYFNVHGLYYSESERRRSAPSLFISIQNPDAGIPKLHEKTLPGTCRGEYVCNLAMLTHRRLNGVI